jgi:glucan phosphoethanolaminetransferase (alkaline phosphatase superfamily)
MRPALRKVRTFFLGDTPRGLWMLLTPTLTAIALDFILRARTILSFRLAGKGIYLGGILVSAAFWALPFFFAGKLFRSNGPARVAIANAFFALWVLPIAIFGYGGQALYFRVFGVYIGRDTVRLGIALRGTLGDWFKAWGGPWIFVAIFLIGLAVTLGFYFNLKRKAASLPTTTPWLLVITFIASLGCFWFDEVDSRFLQAAPPDACFVHGAMHALRARVTGKWNERQGMSIRTPAPMPPLVSQRNPPRNVILVMTESVRGDAICSDPQNCKDEALDAVIPDRMPLGILDSQTPNTFSSCMVLWSGLAPNVDYKSAHTAPLLWEVAKAAGYDTAYITSQNPNFEDFGAYVRHAGIDTLVTATDLGGMAQEQLGAPDERATARTLEFLRQNRTQPFFVLMQFSNTHAPYRTDPNFLPYQPESDNPIRGVDQFHNHYRNAVRLQERTLAAFLTEVKKLPTWDDTVLVFVSDHGEEFRDHGGLYHNHALYEEQLRIPGFIVAGKNALSADDLAGLTAFRKKRAYAQDVHATVVDLFGVHDAAPTFPLANLVGGRSLLKPPPPRDYVALLSTSTSVWQPDDARFGVRVGEQVVMGGGPSSFLCFNTTSDPEERLPIVPVSRCGLLTTLVNRAFEPNMRALGWK